MMQAFISPHYTPEKLQDPTVGDLVDVLEDRVRFWLLEPAKFLAAHPFGQVAGFNLLLSYFEGIWIYIQGQDSRNQSRHFFEEAFVDVFRSGGLNPEFLRRIARVLYEDARCGFFHDGLFRSRIYFGKVAGGCLSATVPERDGVLNEMGEIPSIRVDVEGFFNYVQGHFGSFLESLRDPAKTDMRARFQEICREKWDYEGPPQVMAPQVAAGRGWEPWR